MGSTKKARSTRASDVKVQDGLHVVKKQRGDDEAGPSSRASVGRGAGIQVSPVEKLYIDTKVTYYSENTVVNEKLDEHDLKECVSEVMRHMLAANHMKPNMPVSHQIILTAIKNLQSKGLIASAIITKAQSCFNTFGMEMVQLVHGSQKSYVLRSLLPRQFMVDYIQTQEDLALDGLKAYILSFLHLHADKANEDDVWAHLELVGFTQSPHPHPSFGRPTQEVLQMLVDQKYLSVKADSSNGDIVKLYAPGEAATGDYAEVTENDIKLHISALLDRSGK